MNDALTRKALATAAALLDAAANGDRDTMRAILSTVTPEPAGIDLVGKLAYLVAPFFGATIDQVLGDTRQREALEARHVVFYVAHHLGLSYSQIGRQMGRDHSTVMHGCSRVNATPRLLMIARDVIADETRGSAA